MPRLHIPFLRRRIRYRKLRPQSPLRRLILAALYALLCITPLLLIPAYLIYRPPHALVTALATRYPEVIWQVSVPSSRKILALTIDDAPSKHTPEILRLLKLHNATATFFIIGSQVPGRETQLTDIVRQGHELANHGMYDEPAKDLSDATLRSQLATVQSYIASAYLRAGVSPPWLPQSQLPPPSTNSNTSNSQISSKDNPPKPTKKYFRPGSGFFTKRMLSLLREAGYTLALGSIYPYDAQIPFPRLNAWYIVSKARSGAVIVCHDRRTGTIPMLNRVLSGLSGKGWEITSLSGLQRIVAGT